MHKTPCLFPVWRLRLLVSKGIFLSVDKVIAAHESHLEEKVMCGDRERGREERGEKKEGGREERREKREERKERREEREDRRRRERKVKRWGAER